jgi:hypothetical protein
MNRLYKILGLSLVCFSSSQLIVEAQRKSGHSDFVKAEPIINIRRFYDHRAVIHKNGIAIQSIQLANSAKFTYERVLNKKIAIGVNSSVQFAGKEKGTLKNDFFVKYFLTFRAPIGLYLYSSHGVASVKNHDFIYRKEINPYGETPIANNKNPLVVERTASFSTYIGTLGFGFQNVTGIKRNIIIDFGLGYQFFNTPNEYKKGYNLKGTSYNVFDTNQRILGPLSPFQARLGLGYMF